jgi:hypothetical protein
VDSNVRNQDDYQDEPQGGVAGEIRAVTTHANCHLQTT